MIVGLDFDGVLVHVDEFMSEIGTKLYGPIKNPKGYTIAERFGVSEEADKKFWDAYRREYVRKPQPVFGLMSLNEFFKETKTQHFVITNRGDDAVDPEEKAYIAEKTRDFVDNWLPYTTAILHNGIGTKLPLCLNYKIDVMIEDCAKHVIELCQYMKCIVITRPHNDYLKHPNVAYAKDLMEATKILESYGGKGIWPNKVNSINETPIWTKR